MNQECVEWFEQLTSAAKHFHIPRKTKGTVEDIMGQLMDHKQQRPQSVVEVFFDLSKYEYISDTNNQFIIINTAIYVVIL